jgi:hypothetical protein
MMSDYFLWIILWAVLGLMASQIFKIWDTVKEIEITLRRINETLQRLREDK